MNMNKSQIKDIAKKFGADLIGVAPIERFESLPPEQNPKSIFPQAKNMIILGRKIPRGALRGIEEGTEFELSYLNYGFYALEDQFLSKTTYDVVIYLESLGFEAVPLFAYEFNGQVEAIPVASGKPAPNVYVPQKFAAHAAGLGSVGRNGLFLTPEYGPMQRFAMIISDVPLDGDEIKELGFCDKCNVCLKSCPLAAFNPQDTNLPARRDNDLCKHCQNGAFQCSEGRFNVVDRQAAECSRSCLAALEERDLLTVKFQHKFRNKPAWKRDYFGDVIA